MEKLCLFFISILTVLSVNSQTIVKKANSELAVDGRLEKELALIINSGGPDNTANFRPFRGDDNRLIKDRSLEAGSKSTINYGTDNSLEVLTWNIEFFPLNGTTTTEYMSSLIQALDVDIIAFQEVAEVDVFNQMIDNIAGYDAFVGTTDDLIKLAYVYKTDAVQVNNVYEIYTGDEYILPFLRRPLVMECTYNGENFVIINNHFKALGDGVLNTDDPNDEENRRWVATNLLKDYIDNNFPSDNVIVLGDLNDIINDEYVNNVFQEILNNPDNYAFADYEIAVGLSDDWSYPNYPAHIDHIIISNELYDEFYAHSSSCSTLKIENFFDGGWNDYQQNISDHRPVGLKLFTDDAVVFNKNLEDQSITSGGWTSHNITGPQIWLVPETQFGHNNSYCAYMNGYDNGAQENENWLVSPAFSPDDYNNLRLSFWNTSAYSGPGLQLLWSDNFSGDPAAASWAEIENVQWHDGTTDWEWIFSGIIDLNNLTGAATHIAFKYVSTAEQSAAWELDDIILSDAGNLFSISASANPSSAGTVSGTGNYVYGETVEISATPETNYSFVNWTENGNVVSADKTYSFSASGNRSLTANFTTETGITVRENESFAVTPNPASDYIYLNNSGITALHIYSLRGVCVKSINNTEEMGRLDVSDLKAGMYILHIKTLIGNAAHKLLIQR